MVYQRPLCLQRAAAGKPCPCLMRGHNPTFAQA